MKSLIPHAWTSRDSDVNPFATLQNEVDRVFGEFSRNTPFSSVAWSGNGNSLVPHMDVSESDEEIIVTAELPGVDEKDIDISAENAALTIKAEKRAEKEDNSKNYRLVERSYGLFQRSIPLPYDIEGDKVAAKFDNGVLTIKMPKPAEVKSKRQKIKIG